MSADRLNEGRVNFFDRPGELVANDMSAHWMKHEDRKQIFPGQARLLGIETTNGVQYFNIEELVLFSHESTMKRWKNSRGPQIMALEPGEVICYDSRGRVLAFTKTQGAENLMFSHLRRTDRLGNPLPGEDNVVTSSKIPELAGFHHRSSGLLTPFEFRGQQALLLSIGGHVVSEEELQRLQDELLGPDN